jgi:hypothetical protein
VFGELRYRSTGYTESRGVDGGGLDSECSSKLGCVRAPRRHSHVRSGQLCWNKRNIEYSGCVETESVIYKQ